MLGLSGLFVDCDSHSKGRLTFPPERLPVRSVKIKDPTGVGLGDFYDFLKKARFGCRLSEKCDGETFSCIFGEHKVLPPLQGGEFFWIVTQGGACYASLALGCNLSGLQPV